MKIYRINEKVTAVEFPHVATSNIAFYVFHDSESADEFMTTIASTQSGDEAIQALESFSGHKFLRTDDEAVQQVRSWYDRLEIIQEEETCQSLSA